MLDRQSIARVKMAQRDAGLDDAAYRQVLAADLDAILVGVAP